MNSYVYILIDPRNLTPFYVGKGVKNRWRHHMWKGPHRTNQFVAELRNAGVEPKCIIAREFSSEEDALLFERKLIAFWGRRDFDEHGLLLNRNIGGAVGKGVSWTAERRALFAEAKKSSGNPMFGRTHTTASREIISAARRCNGGHPHSDEHKIRLRDQNPGGLATRKAVAQIDDSGNVVNVWSSVREAAIALGASKGNISSVASGRKSCKVKGFRWKYV